MRRREQERQIKPARVTQTSVRTSLRPVWGTWDLPRTSTHMVVSTHLCPHRPRHTRYIIIVIPKDKTRPAKCKLLGRVATGLCPTSRFYINFICPVTALWHCHSHCGDTVPSRSLPSPLQCVAFPFRLYVNWRFMRGIEAQFLALQKGFNELIPQHLLKPFDQKELEVSARCPRDLGCEAPGKPCAVSLMQRAPEGAG